MIDEVTIYKLIDPVTESIRYIGWTHKSLKRRLIDHLSDARRGLKNHRCNWIRELLSDGFYPLIDTIETVRYGERSNKEKYWISYYGRENLVNGTDGGEGVCGLLVSEETRKKQSSAHISQTPWNKGVSPSLETRQKSVLSHIGQIAWNKGIPCLPEVKKKISESKKGKSYGKSSRTKGFCFGVTFERKSSKWIAQIRFENKTYFIGKYETETQAGIAYDLCSIWISKRVRLLNFPEKEKEYLILMEENHIGNLKELRILIKRMLGG